MRIIEYGRENPESIVLIHPSLVTWDYFELVVPLLEKQYHLLIPAGVNWYEAHSRIEMIPDGETSVTILTTPMEGGETVGRVLRLDHFPNRKNRATRLRMTIYFSSAHRCEIEVEDLGFGGITPPSGRVWKRQVIL